MVTKKETLNNAIKSIIAPQLKSLGFKKSGRNFYRMKGDFIQVINFQGSWTGGIFFVNLGVLIYSIPKLWGDDFILLDKPLEGDCHFQARLTTEEDREKGHCDHIWNRYANQEKTDRVVKRLLPTLLGYGITWLDNLSNYRNIIHIYETQKDKMLAKYMVGIWRELVAAIAYEKLGNHQKAYECITELIESKYFSNFGQRTKSFILEVQKRNS